MQTPGIGSFIQLQPVKPPAQRAHPYARSRSCLFRLCEANPPKRGVEFAWIPGTAAQLVVDLRQTAAARLIKRGFPFCPHPDRLQPAHHQERWTSCNDPDPIAITMKFTASSQLSVRVSLSLSTTPIPRPPLRREPQL